MKMTFSGEDLLLGQASCHGTLALKKKHRQWLPVPIPLNSKGTEARTPNVLPKKAESKDSLVGREHRHSRPQMHRGRSLFPVSD